MSREHADDFNIEGSFPRVSGDEPARGHIIIAPGEFSPRERG